MFTVVGRAKFVADDYFVISSINQKNREINVKVFVSGNILKHIREHMEIGDICGVKGFFDTKNDKLVLVADKVTFLGKSESVSDTRGEEIEDE